MLMRQTASRWGRVMLPSHACCKWGLLAGCLQESREVQEHKSRETVWPKMKLGEEQKFSSSLFLKRTDKGRSCFIAQTPWRSWVGIKCCPLSCCSILTGSIGFWTSLWTALNSQGEVDIRPKEMINFGLSGWEFSMFLTFISSVISVKSMKLCQI